MTLFNSYLHALKRRSCENGRTTNYLLSEEEKIENENNNSSINFIFRWSQKLGAIYVVGGRIEKSV